MGLIFRQKKILNYQKRVFINYFAYKSIIYFIKEKYWREYVNTGYLSEKLNIFKNNSLIKMLE